MDNKFLDGNDDEVKQDVAENEEVVLFSKSEDSEEENVSEETVSDEMASEETASETTSEETSSVEGTDDEDEVPAPEADEDSDIDVVEKKAVAAPEKTKKEKSQSVLFFVIIGLGILAFLILIVAGVLTLSKKYGWFDKKDNNQINTSADAENETLAVDYSEYIDDTGYIKDIDIKDYVKLCDYKNITVDYSEIKPSDSDMQEQIDKVLESYETLSTDTDALTQLGDKLNIDYVGKIDGVEFDGGNTQGQGTDLVLGSKKYIDDFEDQLVGHKVGDTVTVEATFPENYGNENLNGKTAEFEVVINGIYIKPELTDEFVKENLSDYADSVDAYKEYLENALAESNKSTYVWNYVVENSEVSGYPEDYYNNELEIYKTELENQYNYYDQYYYASTGSHVWNSIYEFYDVDETEFDGLVKKYAEDGVKQNLVVQAIADDMKLEVTQDDLLDYLTGIGYESSSYDSIVQKYGQGYIYQNVLVNMVKKSIVESAKVNK